MMDLKKLNVLVRVVELGSVTAAADSLSHTPSAVSQQLRRLEVDVGQPLLRRRARGIVPTEAGSVLVGHARKVLRQLEAAESDLNALAEGRKGSLIVGAFPTLAASFLPGVLEVFSQAYPHIEVTIRSSRFSELVEWLERGKVDLSFLWDHPWRPFSQPDLRVQELFDEEFVVLVANGHPLAGREEISIDDLSGETWLVRADRHPVVEVLERVTASAGFRPSIAMYANDYQETQAMVSVGMGVALAPRSAVVLKHPGVTVLSLGRSAPRRRVLLAQREERVYSAAETAFQAAVWQALADRSDASR